MDTVRLARDAGDIAPLFPEGLTLATLPYTLHDAIKLALYWLSFDELPSDERPPRDIWMDGEAMSDHWRKVERDRKAKYGDDSGAAVDGDSSENEYLNGLR